MKVLFFTEISPFPINGGERIRSYGLLKALSELGHHIDAIIANIDKINLNDYSIENVKYHEYKPNNKSFIQDLTLAYYFNKDQHLIQLIHKIIAERQPDIALIDYGFLGQYISLFTEKGIPVIYGTHNAQSQIVKQLPVKGIIRKVRKSYRTLVEQFHEKYYFKKAQNLITVSEEDKNYHSNFYPSEHIYTIPNFLDESKYSGIYKRDNYFVMTANFYAYQNFEGIKWFLNNIWDKDLDKKHQLILVGRGSDELHCRIPELASYSNLSVKGSVENIIPYIAKAKAVIIPLLHGSGSRLKCLEAMALGTPIISTTKGVEGINSESIIIADSDLAFKSAITNFSYDEELSKILKNEFHSTYSLPPNKTKLKKILSNTISC